jgi:hypothetical protein
MVAGVIRSVEPPFPLIYARQFSCARVDFQPTATHIRNRKLRAVAVGVAIRLVLGSGAIVQVWLELRDPIQATTFSFVSLEGKDNRSPRRKPWQKAKSDYRIQNNDEFQFWR